MKRSHRWLWIALSIAACCAAPLLVHAWLTIAHAQAYAGVCGPHAPDIPARPCSYDEYLAEFGAGFGGIGLFLVEAAVFVGMVVLVASLWTLRALLRRNRP